MVHKFFLFCFISLKIQFLSDSTQDLVDKRNWSFHTRFIYAKNTFLVRAYSILVLYLLYCIEVFILNFFLISCKLILLISSSVCYYSISFSKEIRSNIPSLDGFILLQTFIITFFLSFPSCLRFSRCMRFFVTIPGTGR